ncbi:MAG: amino acid adenylation domain-containing protein [Actinomycetota bacterium]
MTETESSSLDERRRLLLAQMLNERGITTGAATGDSMPPTVIDGPAEPRPLSSAQARVWFQQELNPDGAVYNLTCGLRLAGELDLERLQGSVDRLVARNAILHTTYEAGPDGPRQIERPDLRVVVTDERLDDADKASVAAAARRPARRPFDLSAECPLRVHAITLPGPSFAIIAIVHHIAADYASLILLLDALGAGFLRPDDPEEEVVEPDAVVRYSDHALWEATTLAGRRADDLVDYWRSVLEPPPAPISLPYDRRPVGGMREEGSSLEAAVAGPSQDALFDLGRSEGATPFMTALAALAVLLHRVTGSTDLPIGMPAVFRDDPEIAEQIGNFQNTLVLRPRIEGDESFRTVLAAVVRRCREAYAHQDLPFERLVAELAPSRVAGRTPYIDVLLIEQRDQMGSIETGPLDVEQISVHNDTSQFPLTLSLAPGPDELQLLALYQTDLFDAATVATLLDLYGRVIDAVVDEPDRPVGELDLLRTDALDRPGRDDDRERRVGAGLAPEASPATTFAPSTLIERFLTVARDRPEAVAVRHRGRSVTYDELLRRATVVRNQVAANGAGPGHHVLVLASPGVDALAAIVGVALAGAAYVPVDVGNPSARIEAIAADAEPVCAVVTADVPDTRRPANLPVVVIDAGSPVPDADGPGPAPTARPDDPAYIIYTSGSTGTPKGVVVSNRSVTRLFDATADLFRFDEHDRWTLCHSLGFDFSVWEMWGPLLTGGAVVVADPDVVRDPQLLLALIVDEGVTVLNQTPSAFAPFAATACRAGTPTPLRWVVFGGEALDPTSLGTWFDTFGDDRPRLVNMYGITETTVHVTARLMTASDADFTAGSPIGEPLPDLRLLLLDAAGHPVPDGVAGEIHVGGAGVSRYHRRPELDRERFVTLGTLDPDANGGQAERFYRTGDLARRRADGELLYLGRIDDQHQVRGFRVELGEVESILHRATGVAQAAVVVVGDQLAAYLVAEPGAVIDPGTVRADAGRHLPEHMIPGPVVTVDALPLTVNGKIDRSALAARPITTASSGPAEAITGTAAMVAEIWADLLPAGTVIEPDVGFFDLGGHSLLLTRVRDELAARTGRPLPIAELYAHPTPRTLARFLDGATSAEPSTAAANGLASGGPGGDDASTPHPAETDRTIDERANRQRAAMARLRRRPTPSAGGATNV